VNDGEGREREAPQRVEIVEVGDDRRNAAGTKTRCLLDAADEPRQSRAAVQHRRSTQRHVTASDQQYPDHACDFDFAPKSAAFEHLLL